MVPPRVSPRLPFTSRKWPASILIAIYSAVQSILSGCLSLDGASNRDAHAIARGLLHFLSCLVLLCGSLSTFDDSVLLALAASLSILVDGGVRALAAATSLSTTTKRRNIDLPEYIVYSQVVASLCGTLVFHLLPRYWSRRRNGNINTKNGNNNTVIIPPLYVSARAHSFSTLLVRFNLLLPTAMSGGDLMQLLYACAAVCFAAHSAQFSSTALLRSDPVVAAAQRALYDTGTITLNTNEFAKVWRDQSGTVRAVVSIRDRQYRDSTYAANAKSRIRAALAGLVDDLYIQVEAVQPSLVRSGSLSQAIS